MKFFIFIAFVLFASSSYCQSKNTDVQQDVPQWIWYPNDFEIWLGREVLMRRSEKGHIYPPFWKQDTHFDNVRYRKHIEIDSAETFEVYADGDFNVMYNFWNSVQFEDHTFTLPKGKYDLHIAVVNNKRVPALWLKSKHFKSDTTWEVSDNSGKWVKADAGNFLEPSLPPSDYHLQTSPLKYKTKKISSGNTIYDFGKETFSFIKLIGIKGQGKVYVYYGESENEVLHPEYCETYDIVNITTDSSYSLPVAKGFRYINIVSQTVTIEDIRALYEFLPLTTRGSFRSSNEKLNTIWNTAAYTLTLNTREFFLDGIKRDRTMWSGDAYQSYLINYYLFFDEGVTRRTMVALRGKDPIHAHINTILDYTLFWFNGIYDYYQYTGDKEFVKKLYPSMVSLMDFCLKRTNANGMMEGQPNDWVFVDWADMEKDGELCFEQILLCRSLETITLASELIGNTDMEQRYKKLASNLKDKIINTFWSDENHAFMHSRKDGLMRDKITRYPNIFALLYNYVEADKKEQIEKYVLKNKNVQSIKTPYMRFYELAALCEVGEQKFVLNEMLSYWGGMLDEGATTFWEEYDPTKKGDEHLAMYGRPYGKSLCHAWGAGPVYLLGRYYIGAKPLTPGYETYVIEPELAGLEWVEGVVPTPKGDISVYCTKNQIKITGSSGTGLLRFKSQSKPSCKEAVIKTVKKNTYELLLEKSKTYTVKYKAVSA